MRRSNRDRQTPRRSRGAAMTEAAIVSPVFFALLFGVIEFALLFRSNLTVANTARDAARTAAAAGNDIDADYRILQTARQSAAAANMGDIQRIVIFQATSQTDPVPPTCKAGTRVTDVCNVYTPADFTQVKDLFNCLDPYLDRSFCPTKDYLRDVRFSSLGYIGVYVELRHSYITRIFGSHTTIRDTVVLRIEPRTAA